MHNDILNFLMLTVGSRFVFLGLPFGLKLIHLNLLIARDAKAGCHCCYGCGRVKKGLVSMGLAASVGAAPPGLAHSTANSHENQCDAALRAPFDGNSEMYSAVGGNRGLLPCP